MTKLADRQHGVVGRRQLFAAGLCRGHVDELVRSGRLVRVSRGVYRVAGAPLTPRAEMMAASLRCGPGARIVGERVLEAMGVHTARRDGPFEVLTRPGRTVTGVDWACRQASHDLHEYAALVTGIPSVTPARNLLETAVRCDEHTLERLVDGARWVGRLDAAVALAHALPAHRGARRLLRSGLVDAGAPESGAERELCDVLAGLGGETQVWITPGIRVDMFFRPAGLVVERDPSATHGGPTERDARAARDSELEDLGLLVEHVDDDAMRAPEALRARIEARLRVLGDRHHARRTPRPSHDPA